MHSLGIDIVIGKCRISDDVPFTIVLGSGARVNERNIGSSYVVAICSEELLGFFMFS